MFATLLTGLITAGVWAAFGVALLAHFNRETER